MNTPTPRTDEARRIDNGDTHPLLDEMETLERELAAEREKVKALREALDEAQSCGGLTGAIFMQARAALAATEDKP